MYYNHFMKISRFKKYISWNIISIIGYFCAVIAIVFYVLLTIASSGTTVRADINEIFFKHIINHIISPYMKFYRLQILFITLCMLISVYENKYYINTQKYGARWFANHEKLYTAIFVTGLCLNLLPLYIFLAILISWGIKML